MVDSVKEEHRKGIKDYNNMKRQDFVVGRCGMAVLCINMTFWTLNTETALKNEGLNGIKKYHSILKQ